MERKYRLEIKIGVLKEELENLETLFKNSVETVSHLKGAMAAIREMENYTNQYLAEIKLVMEWIIMSAKERKEAERIITNWKKLSEEEKKAAYSKKYTPDLITDRMLQKPPYEKPPKEYTEEEGAVMAKTIQPLHSFVVKRRRQTEQELDLKAAQSIILQQQVNTMTERVKHEENNLRIMNEASLEGVNEDDDLNSDNWQEEMAKDGK